MLLCRVNKIMGFFSLQFIYAICLLLHDENAQHAYSLPGLPSVLEQEIARLSWALQRGQAGTQSHAHPQLGTQITQACTSTCLKHFWWRKRAITATGTGTLEQAGRVWCCMVSSPYLSLRETNSLSLSYVPSATFICPLKPFLIW